MQKHRGWISNESVKILPIIWNISPAEVDSVATFYNLIFRKPVGSHVILVV